MKTQRQIVHGFAETLLLEKEQLDGFGDPAGVYRRSPFGDGRAIVKHRASREDGNFPMRCRIGVREQLIAKLDQPVMVPLELGGIRREL